MKIGDIVVWHAQSSQRLAAIVTKAHEDGTLDLKVRSDTSEEIWSGEGWVDNRARIISAVGETVATLGDTWTHLHRNLAHGNTEFDAKTGLQIAQLQGVECWLTVDETNINLNDANDLRLKASLAAISG